MRVVIVCGAGMVSGKEIMALELGTGLREQGHEVSCVTSRWGDGEFGRRLQRLGIPARFMRLGFISATLSLDCLRMTLDQLLRVPGLWLDYTRFLRQEKPEQVIHTNWHHLLVLWPFLQPGRDWFWLHEVIPDKPQYRRVFQGLAGRLRGFIPVSHAVKASLLRIGIPGSKIQVIHNGITDPVGAESNHVRTWPGLRLGIVGQVAPWKGQQDLLEAFGTVAKTHPDAELHFYGKGAAEFERQLKQRAEVLGLSSRLVWHGFVTERKQIYDCLDVCAVPSRTEDPLPTVAIEAAFFGLPVVAARIGGLPEIVVEGITGLLHEAGNQAELAARLDMLLGSAALRQDMGAAARNRALKCFSQSRFVAEFEHLMSATTGSCLQPHG